MSLEQEMMFANFSEKLKGWYNKYECANEYRKCKEESLQEENFNERRIGSLRYLKEVNKIEAMFYILICLQKECCGTDIMQQVQDMTDGRVRIGPGTLYNLLDQFLKNKMIFYFCL